MYIIKLFKSFHIHSIWFKADLVDIFLIHVIYSTSFNGFLFIHRYLLLFYTCLLTRNFHKTHIHTHTIICSHLKIYFRLYIFISYESDLTFYKSIYKTYIHYLYTYKDINEVPTNLTNFSNLSLLPV